MNAKMAQSVYLDGYIPKEFIERHIPAEDRMYLENRMTLESYLRVNDLIVELNESKKEEKPLLDHISEPHLIIMPEVAHPLSSTAATEKVF